MDYADWAFRLFGFSTSMMPPVVDSAGEHFGRTHSDIFGGHSIPIRAVMADQVSIISNLDVIE